MSGTALKLENLSKLYRIGLRKKHHDTVLGLITSWIKSPVVNYRSLRGLTHFHGRFDGNRSNVTPHVPVPLHLGSVPYLESSPIARNDVIWALRDVTFEVKAGEVVGIIGRNGAGKSTLLKILSKITDPTRGRAIITGRVASLLEVGTGFHPDLTGRENIYLNATILGMAKNEVNRKFDAIVDFAEVEKFIDTPVKHYSSGMYVRLAFAIAAHLDPEILFVDEVLAVGDAGFQKKCIGRMGDAAKTGRTILFVSHQMNQIRRLCQKCVWLADGRLKMCGKTVDVVNAYEAEAGSRRAAMTGEHDNRPSSARFIGWDIMEPSYLQQNTLSSVGAFTLRFTVEIKKPIRHGRHGIALFNNQSQLIWATAFDDLELKPGASEFIYDMPGLPLLPGVYYWYVTLYDETELADAWTGIPELVIATKPVGHAMDTWHGILNFDCTLNVRDTYDRSMGF